MTGKLVAQDGKRDELLKILLRAADLVGQMTGCRLYAVAEDATASNLVWVMEIWDTQSAHDESLKDPRVRALIGEAMPLLGGAPESAVLNVVGGHGV